MSKISNKYNLKPTKNKIKGEIVYDLIYSKDLEHNFLKDFEDNFFKINLL